MAKKEKKILFSEEIDSKISGFALVLAFLSIGIFLLLYPDYFGNILVASVIRWIFILIGTIGLIGEFPKNRNSNIKGFENLFLGAVLVGLWILLFIFLNIWWINIISFFLLLIALYGLYRGLIEIIHSTYQTIKNNKGTKKKVTIDIIMLITKFASLLLVIVQIIKALGT